MPGKSVAESITVCAGDCGAYLYPKRLEAGVARAAAEQLHGKGVLVRASTGRDLCAPCRQATAPYPSTVVDQAKEAAERAAKEKLAAERQAAAEKARATIEAGRAARAAKRRVHTVRLGQGMVRI